MNDEWPESYNQLIEWIGEWELFLLSAKSFNTARSYQSGMSKFVEFLGNDTLSPNAFIEFVLWLPAQGLAQSTQRLYSTAAKQFADWLALKGKMQFDYQFEQKVKQAVKATKKRGIPVNRMPKEGYALQILNVADEQVKTTFSKSYRNHIIAIRDRAFVYCLASTGCRINEMLSLKYKDMDCLGESRGKALVTETKFSKPRTVYFSSEALDALGLYKEQAELPLGAPLFCRHDLGVGNRTEGITATTGRAIVGRLCDLANIPRSKFTPHSFRHQFAISTLEKTDNLAAVMTLMGHSSMQATLHYAKVRDNSLEDLHEKVWG